MNESCSCITAHPPQKYDYKYGHTVGTIYASTETKDIDLDGNELGLDEPGEMMSDSILNNGLADLTRISKILTRGPQITIGYLNDPKTTTETFDKDGWLHIDEEGMLTITDRTKEIIKVKGIGVARAELEDLLFGHSKLEDVAVMSVSDDYTGERPKAYVDPKENRRQPDRN